LNKLGPGTCDVVVADLKDKAGCDHLVAEVKKMTDRLTVLLNNSGASWFVAPVARPDKIS
jgi:NAD(P)-dependent dehydrogenase (short-subunit alcohol dehydrogenase family)